MFFYCKDKVVECWQRSLCACVCECGHVDVCACVLVTYPKAHYSLRDGRVCVSPLVQFSYLCFNFFSCPVNILWGKMCLCVLRGRVKSMWYLGVSCYWHSEWLEEARSTSAKSVWGAQVSCSSSYQSVHIYWVLIIGKLELEHLLLCYKIRLFQFSLSL